MNATFDDIKCGHGQENSCFLFRRIPVFTPMGQKFWLRTTKFFKWRLWGSKKCRL